jgi:hypothetical protein
MLSLRLFIPLNMLTNKAKEVFEIWLRNSTYGNSNYGTEIITEWFDTVGITVDVMPRMADENRIVFEPNTFCLKHEIVTEDFIQFEKRQEAIENAIIQANVIYNIHFVDSNQAE